MDKNTFFLNALKAGLFKKKAWVISVLSLIQEDPKAWELKPYAYRIVQNQAGHFFCNPDNPKELIKIDDAVASTPIIHFRDTISLKAGDLPNIKQDMLSTTGNLFFNICSISSIFGDKIDYINQATSVSYVEKIIAARLENDPGHSSDKGRDNKFKNTNPIFVSEYLRFIESISYLTGFTQLCTWGATEKMLKGPPGIKEYKKQLLEENKDRLFDPEVIANIDKKLIAYDAAYLKGDPCENFLLSKKSRNTVRKKMFLMMGAEPGLSKGVGVDLIQSSLEEGWELNKFASMNNTLRAGSYNRGQETQLGGVAVKDLLRASTNLVAEKEDCGSTMGKTMVISETNTAKIVGFTVVTAEGLDPVVTAEDAGKYLGKTIKVRSPLYCKLPGTEYCFACLGSKLSLNPYGLSLAVSQYGSAMLGIFMSAAHSKALETQKMDYKTLIT
jgi:hypothetical protein